MEDDPSGQALVLCVGVDPSDGLGIAQATGGRAVIVMVTDAAAARDVLDRTNSGPPAPDEPRPHSHLVESGPLALDLDRHRARWQGREFELHGLEFDLMTTLASDPGRVWTFEELTARVWSHSYLGDPSAVSSAVKRLRRRLREQQVAVEIESVRGIGFRLCVVPQQRRDPDLAHAEG